jgi:hypothetical protein
MNLFIGLLNLAIGDYNKKEEYLLQKAKVTFFYIDDYIKFILLINTLFFFKDYYGD